MSAATSLYSFLTGNANLEALVGERIYPVVIPPQVTARPVVTFSQESGDFIEHLAGRSDTRFAEFSVDCWGTSYESARAVSDVVETELVGYRGTFGAVNAESIRMENDFDVPPEPDTGLFRVSLRFVIAYN